MPFVRPAEAGDLDALAAFDEWSRATADAIADGTCFVAGHDDRVAAYGIFDRSFFGRPFASIIFVHPEHRQTGLGTALVEHMASLAAPKKLWISTNIENLGMQRTVQKLGFRLVGVVNELADLPELIFVRSSESGRVTPPRRP
jgi:GNAT superfamily N-acetyltransferase